MQAMNDFCCCWRRRRGDSTDGVVVRYVNFAKNNKIDA